MAGDSTCSVDSQEYQHYLEVGLYKNGLSLERGKSRYFLAFDGLKLTEEDSTTEPQGTLRTLGLIGAVEVGPGYLVVIQTQNPVFEYGETTIWNVMESLVIPLKYGLARPYFNVSDSADDSIGGTDISDAELQLRSYKASDATNAFADHVNKGKDILFSKLGIYANDMRSTPSLSLSSQKVNMVDYDDELTDSDVMNDNEISSFKLKRSITIRGLPPQPRESTFTKLFEKTGMQKLEQLDLKTQISAGMLRKIEKQLKRFFSTGDFFYSNELDISKDLQYTSDGKITVRRTNKPPNSFCFNGHLKRKIPEELTVPIIQGYVGAMELSLSHGEELKQGQLLVISKRSTHRAGSRYLRRGIDDRGDVANFIHTSQIVIVDDLLDTPVFIKYEIIRGSIPIFFQQNPANLKPVPYLTRPVEKFDASFQKHFEKLKQSYSQISCVNLVERSKKEAVVGEAYETLCLKYGVEFSWFDFHCVCKKMKYENVVHLLQQKIENGKGRTVEEKLAQYGWSDSITKQVQSGIFRVNCVDCLDRTNLVQKFLSETVLMEHILPQYSLSTTPGFQQQFNNIWADNGDYISRQYASTDALKGDFTRTSKRNYKGLLNDAFLTMSRYYSGYISDYFKQCFIDYVLGHSKEDVFEEYESTLDVLDPNQVSDELDKKSLQLEVIMRQLEIPDDLIFVGSWSGFQSPLEFDVLKLKNGSLKPTWLFLTNKIIYLVQFNEQTSTIVRSVMIPVEDVKALEYGTYILSTHNSISRNPRKNIGLKFIMPVRTMPALAGTDMVQPSDKFVAVKFPSDMDYSKVKHIINLISKTCHSTTLEKKDIMTEQEASTDVITMMEYKFKKLVWG